MSRVMHPSHNALSKRSKLWIEAAGEPVFGRGRMMLLRAIGSTGSINRAAKEVNVSYRKAWGYVTAMEKRLGISLVTRQAGGRNGGGAVLTSEAREFIRRYDMLEDRMRKYADRQFRAVFGLNGG